MKSHLALNHEVDLQQDFFPAEANYGLLALTESFLDIPPKIAVYAVLLKTLLFFCDERCKYILGPTRIFRFPKLIATKIGNTYKRKI